MASEAIKVPDAFCFVALITRERARVYINNVGKFVMRNFADDFNPRLMISNKNTRKAFCLDKYRFLVQYRAKMRK